MFSGLIRNVAISAAAFFAVSLVGLLLVPVLISAYGLAGFGQIALARLFLPVAAFAVLDLGFGETATQSVAAARTNGDWNLCSRSLSVNCAAAGLVGSVSAAALAAAAPWLPQWMSVPVVDQPAFIQVLQVTAALLPLFFLAMVFEGVLKGFENFAAQRATEVLSALTYAGLALAAVWAGLPLAWVCLALLVSHVLRALITGTLAWRTLRRVGARPQRWQFDERTEFVSRARVMSPNKVLGAGQANAASLLIGVLLGPTAVGTYDALSRMPRLAKAVLGLLSSTVLPVAARLETALDGANIKRLGQNGLLLVTAVTAPILVGAMAFSEPILRLWLGPTLAPLWPWQAAYFIVPALGAMVGFGASALLVRRHVVASMNRLVGLQLLVMVVVSLAAMNTFQERAFIAGQVTGTLVSFVLQMRLIRREMGIGAATYRALARIFAVSVAMGLPTTLVATQVSSVVVLLLALAAWVLVCWMACFALGLEPGHRRRLIEELSNRVRRFRGH